MQMQKSSEVVMSADNREPMSVDEICEENIQLFMRYHFNFIFDKIVWNSFVYPCYELL